MSDLAAYMRAKNRERRAKAKAAGICIECDADKSVPGLTKCAGCKTAEKIRRGPRVHREKRTAKQAPELAKAPAL